MNVSANNLFNDLTQPLYCCGIYSIFLIPVALLFGGALVTTILILSLRLILKNRTIVTPSQLNNLGHVLSVSNRMVFQQHVITIPFALIACAIIFLMNTSNNVRLCSLLIVSAAFTAAAVIVMKSKISSVIQEFLDIKRLLYLSIYYLSVLPVMSTVLYSGKNRTVGILGGRWYGALFVYFPAATAFFAVILYCAIQAISHQRKIK